MSNNLSEVDDYSNLSKMNDDDDFLESLNPSKNNQYQGGDMERSHNGLGFVDENGGNIIKQEPLKIGKVNIEKDRKNPKYYF